MNPGAPLSDGKRHLTKSASYGLCQRKCPEIKCQENGPLRTGLPIGHGFSTRLWMDNQRPAANGRTQNGAFGEHHRENSLRRDGSQADSKTRIGERLSRGKAWEALRRPFRSDQEHRQMDCGKKGTVTIFGLAAVLLAAGCSIKLPASSFPGFRVAPPTEHKSGQVETTGRPGQSQESLRRGARAD